MTEVVVYNCASFLAPDLKIGVTLASFQISGKTPFITESLKIIVTGFAMRSLTSFTMMVDTLSGLDAFPL